MRAIRSNRAASSPPSSAYACGQRASSSRRARSSSAGWGTATRKRSGTPGSLWQAGARRCLDSSSVATFALIHGGGGSAWDWHLVVPELEERGHEAIAVDLPNEDPSAGWSAYADTVVAAIGDRQPV